jgi:hypothetical protein
MEPSRVTTVQEWPEPKNVKELMTFLGFANFYRRFIARYAKIAAPLTDLLKKTGSEFRWGEREQTAFDKMKKAFTEAPLLRHFDPNLPVIMETDASGFAIAVVISQPFPSEAPEKAHRHPVAFYSRKLQDAERNYETHDAELLAIVEGFKRFRHYLEGSTHPVRVLTDHNNLKYFMTTKDLNSRQARWAEKLARFDFFIEHRPGKSNPADPPSRRPDYEMSEAERANTALPTLQNLLRGTEAGATTVGAVESEDPLEEDMAAAKPALLARLQQVLGHPVVVLTNNGGNLIVAHVQQGQKEPGSEAGTRSAERGRLPFNGETPGSSSEKSLDGADAGQRMMLEPPAGADCCSDHVPRGVIVAAIGTRTAYELDETPLLQVLLESQRKCTFVEGKKKVVSRPSAAGDSKGWRVDPKGLLRKDDKVYVPTGSALREEILSRCHDDPLGGHFGVEKTTELIGRQFFWPGMREEVDTYVDTCAVCQRNKVKRHRPYGVLNSLPVPSKPWEEISMDFITDLPPCNLKGCTYDAILVVVDRFTKLVRYLPSRKDWTAEELAEVFLAEVVCRFGTPAGIVSDRGPVFTSKFWSALCYHLKIRRKLSTAFHPQTDGQTERQNQVLEHYLRCYSNYLQDDWAPKLPHAEFAYNTAKHSSTGMSPFRALYGYEPQLESNAADDVPGGEVPTGAQRAEEVIQLRKRLTENLHKALDSQAKGYNKRHTPMKFAKETWVLLSTKNLKLARPNRKLSERFIGPFQIVDVIGTQAYKLELPPQVRVHPVFHVSLLEPYQAREGEDPSAHGPPEVMPDGTLEYELEAIVNDKTERGTQRFRCRWKSWGPEHDTWQTAEDLENSQELLQEYLKAKAGKRAPPQKRRGRPAKRRKTQ